MFATAAMNIIGSLAFLPAIHALRGMSGFPVAAPPVYLLTIGAFILIFGVAELWVAVTGVADKLFVAVSAAGKLAFFAILVWCWAAGTLPALAVLSGLGDLVFGSLFLIWLYTANSRASQYPAR